MGEVGAKSQRSLEHGEVGTPCKQNGSTLHGQGQVTQEMSEAGLGDVSSARTVFCFGCHVLDLGRAVLLGPGGAEILLRPKTFDVLRHLVENAGRVVSRSELLDAVWPGLHINDDGVTQCVREVRRALSDDAQQFVRTVAKRGYFFAARVALPGAEPAPPPVTQAATVTPPDLSVRRAPRLSLVVLPFANTSGDPGQDYLADAVTDDLTTDLSRMDGAFIIGRGSARTYRARAVDARRVGGELGVRYLVQGSVRKVGEGVVHVNAELVSTETGEELWAERFDQDVRDLGQGQGDIVRRLATTLEARLVDVEAGRSVRDNPGTPDAFDLVLRARSLVQRGPSIARAREAQVLLEQALVLDPRSVAAMVALAYCLTHQNDTLGEWRQENMPRALALLDAAEKLQPDAPDVIGLRGALLLWQGRYKEGQAFYEQALATDPNFDGAHHQIGAAKLHTGDPGGALPFYEESLRRNPRGPYVWCRYGLIGITLLRTRQPAEAVVWLQRAINENPARDERAGLWYRDHLAGALALSGRVAEARREVATIVRLDPFQTARSWNVQQWEESLLGEQLRYVSDGLRLAGLRDHADEDADAGVLSTAELSETLAGLTPISVPGAETIRTDALRRLLAVEKPLVLDVNTLRRTIPGAVILRFDLLGGTLDDPVQERLGPKMRALIGDDTARPIVTLGWNPERWGARNLALRLVALGYTRVHWYRGGKEAWKAHGLPEADAEIEDV